MTLVRRSAFLALIGLFGAGCGGSTASASDASAVANQRLQGSWRLAGFHPSLELELPLRGLLDAQVKTLSIVFSNGEFSATGPGVDTGGRYDIKQASGDSLSGRVYDRAGAGYGISGQFVGNQFQFVSTDAPWTGSGSLERAN